MAFSAYSGTILGNLPTEYSRCYNNFRGVDFSSDHTQVNASRLAYAVNMYKDYKSGEGEALETIAGFRQRANFARRPNIVKSTGIDSGSPTIEANTEVYGIFYFKCEEAGAVKTRVLVHLGNKLFLWRSYPVSCNIPEVKSLIAPESVKTLTGEIKQYELTLEFDCAAVISLKKQSGEDLTINTTYDAVSRKLTILGSDISEGEALELHYYEGVSTDADILFSSMNLRKSAYFICNNKLYLIDGKNYLVYDGEKIAHVKDNAYIPTTYINIVAGESVNADAGIAYRPRNILSPKFKHTFIADGEATDFYMNEAQLDSVLSVTVYGAEKKQGNDYTVDLKNGKITFKTAPKKPTDVPMRDATGKYVPFEGEGGVQDENGEGSYFPYEEGYAGVEIVASKAWHTIKGESVENFADLITKCTLCTTYDNHVFMTGNPLFPNLLFWCVINGEGTSDWFTDPSYFSVTNFTSDGVGLAPITGIMCVSDTLMVLKGDTQQDSAIYFHTPYATGEDLHPKDYPSVQGLSGLGCMGACCNFLDDPVFVSRLGLEGVSQLKIASERANEHRSHLVDAKLVNTDLTKVCLEEWGGYLCLLADGGKVFLADSRQRYQDTTGAVQYEWYYLESIGVWDGQYREYRYASEFPSELAGVKFTHEGHKVEIESASAVELVDEYMVEDRRGMVANGPDNDGLPSDTVYTQVVPVAIGESEINVEISYIVREIEGDDGEIAHRHAYLCEAKGNYTGGTFRKAIVLRSMDDNLFFGCENGVVCSFNFDQRDENGELPPTAYHFDNRTIYCGCATLMDNCEIPHLQKKTVKKSTVIKTRSFRSSAAKVKVRTNRKPYNQIARIESSLFSFEDVDFSNFSFITTEQSLFAVKEKEKKWVEKQYYIYSDEFLKPFSLYYIAFRYRVTGRYKQ